MPVRVTDAAASPPAAGTRLLASEAVGVKFRVNGEGISIVIVAAVTFGFIVLASHFRSTPYNNLSLLADAFVHGRIWVEGPTRALNDPIWENTNDALLWQGHRYVIEGLLPALMLVPFAFFLGENTNQTALATVLCTVAVPVAYVLFRRIGTSRFDALLLAAVLFAGTSLWWCAMLGDVWFIEHVSAVLFTLLALLELTGKRRGWLVALLAAAAFESRFTLVLAVPFYAIFLARGGILPESSSPPPERVRASLRAFALTLVPFVIAYVAWNEARWHTLTDIGYTEFYHTDPWGQPEGSPFRLDYVPYEIYSFFMQSPINVEFRQLALWPWFKVDPHGVALPWQTPVLALAFFARGSRTYRALMWSAILVLWLPSMLYYLDGWTQFGMRHALDFEPFWFVLMAVAARRGMPAWARALSVYSVLFGAWGVWYWDSNFRQYD
jgi:hypothetical protein